MNGLPACRWRERREGDALACHSAKFVAPPIPVSAGFCETCVYCDHAPGEIRYTPGGIGRRIAVATLYTSEMAELGRLSSGALCSYAARHGYEAVVATARIDTARPPSWSKLLLIERHLVSNPACEWLMWVDADAVVTNPARRVEDLIGGDIDFLVAEDLPPSPMNLGVFLIRNCPATLDLLRRAYAKVQYAHHPWWEQPAVVEALAEGGAVRYRVVPRRLFNAFPGEHRVGDFILHFAGSSPEAKLAGVRQAVLAARDDPPEGTFSFATPGQSVRADSARSSGQTRCELIEMKSRDDLGQYLNECGLTGYGLEVGVWRGEFSEILLRSWHGERLYLVDCWRHQSSGYTDITNADDTAMESSYLETLRRMRPYAGRMRVMRSLSGEAAWQFPARYFDFIYIDSNHSYDAVREDLALWYPKLRPGGLFAGHDYLDGLRPPWGEFGVRSAVDEFAAGLGVRVLATAEPDWRSWYFHKPRSAEMV